MGIDFEAEFNQIEIDEAKERAAEAEPVSTYKGKGNIDDVPIINPKPKKEIEPEIDISKLVLIGGVKDVPYEIEKEKEKDTYNKEDDEDMDVDGPDHGDGDDNNQGGTGLVIYQAKSSGAGDYEDFLNDNVNQEDESYKDGEQDNTMHDVENSGIFTNVTPLTVVTAIQHRTIHLEHSIEEGEFIHSNSKEEIAQMMGIGENSLAFDFEEELNNINIAKPDDYVFKYVENDYNYDNVVVEDDLDDEIAKYSGDGTDDFSTF
ncbi:hypothetical protein Hanom_Chr02g00135451 [Helianthus anomalus]